MKVERLKAAFASESGAIMPFVVVLFLTMVVMAGMGVDFMRHEAARADLQNALDRGVLAATAQSQSLAQREDGMTDAELEEAKAELIRSYMKSRTFRLSEPHIQVQVPSNLQQGETAVEAWADYDLSTFFLKIAGFGEMSVPASSYAEQRRVDVEVAVVLDVSGSMLSLSAVPIDPENPSGGNKTKIRAMQDAVIGFINEVTNVAEDEKVLISLIPYSGNVSATPFIANYYGLQPVTNFSTLHSHSYCFEFNTDGDAGSATVSNNPDFTNPSLERPSGSDPYRQYQHFSVVTSGQADYYFGGRNVYDCPASDSRITAFQNDPTTLIDAVNAMTAENFTTTYNGIKWGVGLLHPSAQGLMQAMIEDGNQGVPAVDYDDFPRSYSDYSTQKYLIIMSDGRNTYQQRVTDEDFYTPTEGLTYAERLLEEQNRMQAWNDGYVYSRPAWPGIAVDGSEGDELTRAICDAGKNSAGSSGNLTIFAIGYELDGSDAGLNAAQVLQYCTTNSITDYYNVTSGDDPATAFDQIAARISLLKLAQRRID